MTLYCTSGSKRPPLVVYNINVAEGFSYSYEEHWFYSIFVFIFCDSYYSYLQLFMDIQEHSYSFQTAEAVKVHRGINLLRRDNALHKSVIIKASYTEFDDILNINRINIHITFTVQKFRSSLKLHFRRRKKGDLTSWISRALYFYLQQVL